MVTVVAVSLDVAPLVFVLPADHVSLSHVSLCHVSLDVAPLVFVLPADHVSLCHVSRVTVICYECNNITLGS